jgi:Uma2 family endonuclease
MPFMISSKALDIPPLESGDRLTRLEFEHRYTLSEITKAELIEGVVYVASPARANRHSKPHGFIVTWLGNYAVATPGVDLHIEPTVRLDADNEPQPDALLRIESERGGNSRISEDDYIEGAPELIVEIAASSAAYDLNDKMNAYRRNGVQEYIVWQTFENRIDWFILREGKYVPLLPNDRGMIQSVVFPGLWLFVEALRKGNIAEVLAVLPEGIHSEEPRSPVA